MLADVQCVFCKLTFVDTNPFGFCRVRLQIGFRICSCWILHQNISTLQTVMKRNSVYVAFILGGALLGERVGQERCTSLRKLIVLSAVNLCSYSPL